MITTSFHPGSATAVPGLVLHTTTHRVQVHDQPVQLSDIQFRTLSYLTHHHGRVVTSAELLAFVWGQDFQGSRKLVRNCVAQLRHKLRGSRGPTIENVHSVGYRLVPSS
ncbi:winged helix-turn-helix domain-containing protein [Umezawaea beigongshangensis]|uniref:winged helix-turn-helix domain-containing protein n=1 Tax=Umezawaea beigongshangensis TaxID=2780383 RepID=UPI0018F20410|nr:winged helix-turn-helix domain-containing protein [Umezawaea beigongshangensis]